MEAQMGAGVGASVGDTVGATVGAQVGPTLIHRSEQLSAPSRKRGTGCVGNGPWVARSPTKGRNQSALTFQQASLSASLRRDTRSVMPGVRGAAQGIQMLGALLPRT